MAPEYATYLSGFFAIIGVAARSSLQGISGNGEGAKNRDSFSGMVRTLIALEGSAIPFRLKPTALLILVVLGILLTTLLAAAIPARRAARIDPLRALRQE